MSEASAEKKVRRTINKSSLRERGWTDGHIKTHLGDGETLVWKDKILRVYPEDAAFQAEKDDPSLAARVAKKKEDHTARLIAEIDENNRPRQHGKYAPLSQEKREKVAQDCLKGSNASRVFYAEEIRTGGLFDRYGNPRSYWHCLATEPPDYSPSSRGQWKAKPKSDEGPAGWYWQDWN